MFSRRRPVSANPGCVYIKLGFHREIGRIGRHLAEKPNVEVTMCLGPMPPDASDFPGGIPALGGDHMVGCEEASASSIAFFSLSIDQ